MGICCAPCRLKRESDFPFAAELKKNENYREEISEDLAMEKASAPKTRDTDVPEAVESSELPKISDFVTFLSQMKGMTSSVGLVNVRCIYMEHRKLRRNWIASNFSHLQMMLLGN